eukprot:2877467-Rhodomonas_salina.1
MKPRSSTARGLAPHRSESSHMGTWLFLFCSLLACTVATVRPLTALRYGRGVSFSVHHWGAPSLDLSQASFASFKIEVHAVSGQRARRTLLETV